MCVHAFGTLAVNMRCAPALIKLGALLLIYCTILNITINLCQERIMRYNVSHSALLFMYVVVYERYADCQIR